MTAQTLPEVAFTPDPGLDPSTGRLAAQTFFSPQALFVTTTPPLPRPRLMASPRLAWRRRSWKGIVFRPCPFAASFAFSSPRASKGLHFERLTADYRGGLIVSRLSEGLPPVALPEAQDLFR